jgi:hypothetical protein
MLIIPTMEYLEPAEEEASNEALLHESERDSCPLPYAPPTHKVVLSCTLPVQVHHLKWRLTKRFENHLHIVYMYAEMGNDERTEM